MSIFYGPTERRLYGFVSYEDQDATFIFIKHYKKYLMLDFLSKKDEDYYGRAEARKELAHCEQLLIKWKLHPNWHEETALRSVEQLKKMPIRQLMMELANEDD